MAKNIFNNGNNKTYDDLDLLKFVSECNQKLIDEVIKNFLKLKDAIENKDVRDIREECKCESAPKIVEKEVEYNQANPKNPDMTNLVYKLIKKDGECKVNDDLLGLLADASIYFINKNDKIFRVNSAQEADALAGEINYIARKINNWAKKHGMEK
jgi:preprotein translocase subunit SecA